MSTIRYVVSGAGVSFYVDGKPLIISKSHQNYDAIMAGLKDGDIERIKPLLKEVRQAIADQTDGVVEYRDSRLWFAGEQLHGSLVNRIIAMVKDGVDCQPLVNFLRNLMDNPSYRAVQELYGFLEKNGLPITPDGYFLAYKVIRHDWKDKHTGTMDNSVGATPRMRRNEVDEDKNQTCSKGLHFCGYSYIPHFSNGSTDRIVAVKVNPRDVVSIPTDYNGAKGRACEYYILKELDKGEQLPATHIGFLLVDDGKLDDAAEPEEAVEDEVPTATTPGDDGDEAPVSAPRQTLPGQRVYGADANAKAKALLDAKDDNGQPKYRLSDVARITGMSRRQVARIRDGEVGAAVLASIAPAK